MSAYRHRGAGVAQQGRGGYAANGRPASGANTERGGNRLWEQIVAFNLLHCLCLEI